MNTDLHPPLARIERELFGPETEPAPATAAVDPDRPEDAQVPALPAHLRALIERKVAAAAAHPPGPPAVGQIRSLAGVPPAPGQAPRLRTCAILLGRWVDGRRWAGWLVAQEVDYATDLDLVLQEDDGLFAPEAAVVQTWNPLEVELTGRETILGKVSGATLAAVLKLSAPHDADEHHVAPRPGRIGAWDLDADTTVVTGTPLGEDDPRAAYQQLYRRLAGDLAGAGARRVAAPPAKDAQAARGWRAWLQHTFVRPAWTFGALALVVLQGGWMLAGRQADPDDALRYRGITTTAQADACRTRLRVMFKLDTPYADVVLALRRADATLVSGPSEIGEIWVQPPADQDPREVAAMLRQQRVVERIEIVLPEGHACKK